MEVIELLVGDTGQKANGVVLLYKNDDDGYLAVCLGLSVSRDSWCGVGHTMIPIWLAT